MSENDINFLNYLAWVIFATRDPTDVPTDPVKRRQVALECFHQIPVATSVKPLPEWVTKKEQQRDQPPQYIKTPWMTSKVSKKEESYCSINADLINKINALPRYSLAQRADITIQSTTRILGRITQQLFGCSYVVPVKDLKNYIVRTSMAPLSDSPSRRKTQQKSKTWIILDTIMEMLRE